MNKTKCYPLHTLPTGKTTHHLQNYNMKKPNTSYEQLSLIISKSLNQHFYKVRNRKNSEIVDGLSFYKLHFLHLLEFINKNCHGNQNEVQSLMDELATEKIKYIHLEKIHEGQETSFNDVNNKLQKLRHDFLSLQTINWELAKRLDEEKQKSALVENLNSKLNNEISILRDYENQIAQTKAVLNDTNNMMLELAKSFESKAQQIKKEVSQLYEAKIVEIEKNFDLQQNKTLHLVEDVVRNNQFQLDEIKLKMISTEEENAKLKNKISNLQLETQTQTNMINSKLKETEEENTNLKCRVHNLQKEIQTLTNPMVHINQSPSLTIKQQTNNVEAPSNLDSPNKIVEKDTHNQRTVKHLLNFVSMSSSVMDTNNSTIGLFQDVNDSSTEKITTEAEQDQQQEIEVRIFAGSMQNQLDKITTYLEDTRDLYNSLKDLNWKSRNMKKILSLKNQLIHNSAHLVNMTGNFKLKLLQPQLQNYVSKTKIKQSINETKKVSSLTSKIEVLISDLEIWLDR